MAKERTRQSRRKQEVPQLSEYRGMWLFALFDLPVKEKDQRRAYTRFRVKLLSLGFTQMQYSVYAHYCVSEEASVVKRKAVRDVLPEEGQVRLVSITDKQFGAMEIYYGKESGDPESPLGQMLLF
jgi:CRISPR-associated protein Cas2